MRRRPADLDAESVEMGGGGYWYMAHTTCIMYLTR